MKQLNPFQKKRKKRKCSYFFAAVNLISNWLNLGISFEMRLYSGYYETRLYSNVGLFYVVFFKIHNMSISYFYMF